METSDQNRVCAVIVTYNTGKEIHKCVDSVSPQVHEVVIIDNGSDEATLGELARLSGSGRIKVIYNSRNVGIAKALNEGVEYAIEHGFPWVLTLDHDSEATPGMVEKLSAVHERLGERAGIVSANLFDRNWKRFLPPYKPLGRCGNLYEVEIVRSSGSLMNVQVFAKVGYFNEALFQYYVDDEFCMRLRRAGLKIYFCEDAVLFHSEGFKQTRKFLWREVVYDHYSAQARYYITRNAVYMLRRCYRDRTYSYAVARRLLADHAKLILYDADRLRKIVSSLRGLFDAFQGKYGGLEASDT